MIRIGMDPDILNTGSFVLSWHGFFTFVAVAVTVVLVARWASRRGIDTESVYAVAVWAVVVGIIGARLVHIVDRWDFYSQNFGQVLAVWQGGIALWGAILFGFVGGAGYVLARRLLGRIYSGQTMGWFKKLMGERIAKGYLEGTMYARFKDFSIGKMADISAPGLLIAQTIGRIGDIINGEHLSIRTDLPWGFIYSHPNSPSFQQWGLTASQPVIAYEMIWNMLVLGLIWKLRGRLAPPGMLFALYLMLYALGRFFIQFLRLDKEWFAGLQEAHLIALAVLAITVPLLAYKARFVKPAPETRTARPRARAARRAKGKA
ncbi:MAG: prolipoprotein diacylglyceryl transferase [Chloroflexi bacterium]|nr:prolipoprotein diacylglyceryl transferase [Chloroflexota bacterium]